MNFALGAIILIILLLPGVAIQHSYYASVKTKSYKNIPFSELMLRGLTLSLLVHTIGLFLINTFSNVDMIFLYQVLEGKELHNSNKNLNHLVEEFGLYNLSTISGAWLITKWLKRIIRKSYLDVNYAFLKNTNYWYDIFSARFLEIDNIDGKQSETDLVFLDVRVKGNFIYSGILLDYNFSESKDELENIILHSTVKRIYDHTENNQKPVPIPGGVFIIPNSEIFNVNVHYLNVKFTPMN